MFDGWRRERGIRKVLKGLARQRVALILQPQNVWVIELALQRNEDVNADLMTCHMRGWVEPLHDSMPVGDLTPDQKLPPGALFTRTEAIYRLTDGGWAAINRAHAWTLVGVLIAMLSLTATIIVAMLASQPSKVARPQVEARHTMAPRNAPDVRLWREALNRQQQNGRAD